MAAAGAATLAAGWEMWMHIKDRRKIAKLMVLRGLSARRLSDQLGWKSHSYLARILRGEVRSVSPESACRIAEALEVTVEDLFTPRVTRNAGHSGKRTAA